MRRPMLTRARTSLLGAILLGLLLLGACGGEEEIIRVSPIISVCPSREAPEEECDRPLDLGERPITIPHELELFVFDRGEGALVVSEVGGREVTGNAEVPFTVPAGTSAALPITVTPEALGQQEALLTIASDDPMRPSYELPLRYTGIPKPVPKIELCAAGECGTAIAYDFGLVRRTQQDSVVVEVKNSGTAPLTISEVEVRGEPSQEGELQLLTSTRPGELQPGAKAELVVAYEPLDGVADQIEVVFVTDDPATPEASVTLDGTSDVNLPPVADARQVETGSTSVDAIVEEVLALDGSGSSDPEGDPLRYEWTLDTPARSRSALDDPNAVLVTFVPDVAGSYRAELTVTDSLGQTSEVVSTVLIDVRPRFAFRAHLSWQGGGDLDLHLVAEGGDLFGAGDCYFEDPAPDFGAAGVAADDPELRADVEAPPGGEEIVVEVPASGVYGLYVQYFDDLGAGAAQANVEVIFDDASQPAFSATMSLPRTCSLWHVGDLTFPPAQFAPSTAPIADQCR